MILPFKRPNVRPGDLRVLTQQQLEVMKSYAWSCGFLSAFGVLGICWTLAWYRS